MGQQVRGLPVNGVSHLPIRSINRVQEQEQETARLQEVERRARERQAALEARAQQAREREAWSASVEALERELAAAESAAAAKERETEAHSARLETLKEEKHRLVLDLKRVCARFGLMLAVELELSSADLRLG